MTRAFAVALFALCLAPACATVKVSPERFDRVRSVAIVGFEGNYVYDQPDTEHENRVVQTINVVKTITQVAKGDFVRQRKEQSEMAWAIFSTELGRAFAWSVLPREQVIDNAVYARLREKYHHRYGDGVLSIPGLLGGEQAEGFTPAERAELMQALGVDALVVAKPVFYEQRHVKVSVIGAESGHVHVWARIALRLADGGEESIWNELSADGALSPTAMPLVMGVETNTSATQAMTEAVASSFESLVGRCYAARAEALRKSGLPVTPPPAALAAAQAQPPAAAQPVPAPAAEPAAATPAAAEPAATAAPAAASPAEYPAPPAAETH